ncbi:SprT-like family-domain-containing protein [Sphaerosporella brunnea]|uniref:SprT-like family-domain-containing protein n=1 Tax=Sphaerosporella brunnea TaxID=1250544 RepID=A0A5J5EX20_9PEZI|nr:SprT-like family-domain-containing protein [Sphaerosporella brunnea]
MARTPPPRRRVEYEGGSGNSDDEFQSVKSGEGREEQKKTARLVMSYELSSDEEKAEKQSILNSDEDEEVVEKQSTTDTNEPKRLFIFSCNEEEEAQEKPSVRMSSTKPAKTGPKKLAIFTSDEESDVDMPKPQPKYVEKNKKKQDTGLEDLFSRTTLSETPAKKQPVRTPARRSKYDPVFDSTDDGADSDSDVPWETLKTPAKPVRKIPESSIFEDIIARHSVVEAEDDGRRKSTRPGPSNLPRVPHTVEPETPRKGASFKSPEKKLVRIPPTPYRETHDEFWDQETTIRWNEQHGTEKKPLPGSSRAAAIAILSSDPESESDDDWIVHDDDRYRTPRRSKAMIPAKTPATSRVDKKEWEARKHDMALQFIQEMDRKIENGAVGKYYACQGGLRLEWNQSLRTTAGRARMTRGIIELSPKIITGEERLYDTLAHEFCHLCVWAISRDKKDVHGPIFKSWARVIVREFPHINKITTTHNYKIDYKFEFTCQTTGCLYVWGRQSKPPHELSRYRCPKCAVGHLTQIKPKPRATESAYNRFTKENMARIKQENPGSPMKEVMRLVGQEWRAHKLKTAQPPLREMSDPNSDIPAEASSSSSCGLEHLIFDFKI